LIQRNVDGTLAYYRRMPILAYRKQEVVMTAASLRGCAQLVNCGNCGAVLAAPKRAGVGVKGAA
jgi:hypothetical protein